MADQSVRSIAINARPSEVMAVIADMPAYPEWVPEYKGVEVLGVDAVGRITRARLLIDAAIITGAHEFEFSWAPDGRKVSWSLIESALFRSVTGQYTLDQNDDSTEVIYRLKLEPRMPTPGLLKRHAERTLIDLALKSLKARVESLN